MDNELRRVMFTLGDYEFHPGLSPEEEKEQEEKTRERAGIFHGLATKEECSPQSGNFIEVTYALVENCETGKFEYILPELITFISNRHEKENRE